MVIGLGSGCWNLKRHGDWETRGHGDAGEFV